MQLPGMNTEPVRVSLEVTFWPADNSWDLASRTWKRDEHGLWQLQEMSTSGTPLTLSSATSKLWSACTSLEAQMLQSDEPFANAGPFSR